MNTTKAVTPPIEQDQDQGDRRIHFTGIHQLQGAADGGRQAGDDAGENDHRNAVTDAALSDLLTEPHEEHRAGDQRDHRREDEAEAGVEHEPLILQGIGSAERLHQGKAHRAVARVLGHLATPGLALLAQLIHLRNHDAGHLHDDGRRDIGHHAEGKDAQPLQCAPGEHVEHRQDRAGLFLEELVQRPRIDARNGNEGANPVDDQGADQEQQALTKVSEARCLAKCLRRIRHVALCHGSCCP